MKTYPSKETLRELFDYGEGAWLASGKEMVGGLIWRPRLNRVGHPNTREAGRYAGALRKCDERIQVCVHRKLYELNRLVWIWHHGDIPEGMVVDHKNRNTSDGRIGNLRLATVSQNNSNRGAKSGASSRHKGVYWDADRSKWVAQIKSARKVTYLGSFDRESDAANAYDAAALKMQGEFGVLNNVTP